MASAAGMMGSCGSASSFSLAGKGVFRGRRQRRSSESSRRTTTAAGVRCGYGSTLSSSPSRGALVDQYRTLQIQPGASEREVKKAFRQLALQYHPDVCKGNNCVVQFHRINEAYDMVMNSLRDDEDADGGSWSTSLSSPRWSVDDDDEMRGMCDSTWDLWEEWMGFEGGYIGDYTSHINPYI